jgi:23S rRNA pseudouridine1911/1915/1917 synthase
MDNDVRILFEDDTLLAINKPAGLVVHPDGKTEERTLCDWILAKYPELENIGEPIVLSHGGVIKRPGIVHRIDRETSGVLLIVKTQEAHAHLKKQFQDREIKKIYRAFVYGILKDDDGIINRPIGRSKSDFRKWTAQRGARGEMREAETWYSVIHRGETPDGTFTYVEANPKTGRTHQIRVHFKAIHFPVVCDSLYAPNHPRALGFERLALHAFSIEFMGLDGKKYKIEAPLPADFIEAEKRLAEVK